MQPDIMGQYPYTTLYHWSG
uniref:Uncharacterized protein n=1 Tax=Rhizophora mucronata TaxID=61149 RepID=A0A2P2MZA8_RHIMU